MKKAVAYYRVSTKPQGESDLGLEAQKQSLNFFAKSRKVKLIKEFVEVESGKKYKSPVLHEALAYCINNDAMLIIAKIDRLMRNVAFISTLMESKVKFVTVENPDYNHFILHILAAFAQYEHKQISLKQRRY